MNTTEIAADLGATVDYVKDITERADSTDFDDAAEIQALLLKVKAATDEAIKMLEQQMLAKLEKSRVATAGGRLFKRVAKSVPRTDHAAIALAVRTWAVSEAINKETGEINAQLAAERAAQAYRSLYIAPSTKAKVGQFEKFGIAKDVVTWENIGHKLEIEDLDLPDDD